MANITYRRGIFNRLLKYAHYLIKPTDDQLKFKTTEERAHEKYSEIFEYIEKELNKPDVFLHRCFYKKFRGGKQNRKMLKFSDPLTPKTVWLISVKKYKDGSWKVFGIEQEKALASMDERVLDNLNNHLSLYDYITEQIHNTTYSMKSLQQFINEKMSEETSTEDLNKTTDVDNETNEE